MRTQIKRGLIENNGKIISENDRQLKAEFSYREREKAVKVYFEITDHLNQDAILRGGCRSTVYHTNQNAV